MFELIEDRPHLALFKDRFLPFASQLDQLEPEELPWAIPDVDTGANLPPKLSPDSFSVAVSSGSTSSIPYDLSTSSLDYSSATSSPGPSPAVDPWESKALQRVLVRFNESGDMQIANDITRLVWRCFVRIEVRVPILEVADSQTDMPSACPSAASECPHSRPQWKQRGPGDSPRAVNAALLRHLGRV